MAPLWSDEPRQHDPVVQQAPPPHPRRPMAPTDQSTRRLTGGAADRRDRQARHATSPPLQELFDNREASPRRTPGYDALASWIARQTRWAVHGMSTCLTPR